MFEASLLATVAHHLTDTTRKCILVVDDEVDIRESLQVLLESEFPGVQVCCASSAQEALKILDDKPVTLVISDYKMPGMNGLELLDRVKSQNPRTKRALITAFPESVLVLGKDRPGLEFFLSKPIQVDSIVASTRTAIGPLS